MSEIWNLSTLCRCCHADGNFMSLKTSYQGKNDVEIYEKMLQDTLGISISTPPLEASYNICDKCIYELQVATNFKKQVLLCEEKFMVYCKNEQFFGLNGTLSIKSEQSDGSDIIDNDADDVKITQNVSSDLELEYTIEVDIKHPIEEVQKDEPRTKEEIVDENTNNDKTDNKSEVPKNDIRNRKTNTRNKQELTKNGERRKNRTNLDHSLIIQVDTETGIKFSCKECGGFYQKKKNITQHINKKHGTLFKCEYCPKQYKSLECYKSHQSIHTGNEFQCSYCPKKFAYKNAFKAHVNLHTREKIFQCDLCKKEFKYKQTLIRHLRVHAGTNKKILCDLCGGSFNDSSNLNAHVKSVHLKLRPFQCQICEKTFSNKRHLRDHTKLHSEDSKVYTCDICDHRLTSEKLMKIHRLRHDNKFMCSYCSKIFDDTALRREHVKTSHNKEHPWLPCPLCGKIFVGKYSLNRHMDFHKGIKRFPCEHCDLKFSQKSVLKRHIFRKHNPEADINVGKTKCNICSHSFKNILLHMSSHSKRRSCEICEKTYADNSALNRHTVQKHMGRTFDCDICNKKYLQKSKLNTHKIKVHKIKIEKVGEVSR